MAERRYDLSKLIADLESDDPAKRFGAIEFVVSLRDPFYIPRIQLLLSDSDSKVQSSARKALAELGKVARGLSPKKFVKGPLETWTDLHTAINDGNYENAEALIDSSGLFGSNVNALVMSPLGPGPNQHRTPLHFAAMKGNVALIERLIAKGANVHATDMGDSFKNTPLHFAIESGNILAVAALVSKGADVNARNNLHSPLQLAAKLDMTNIAFFLEQSGATERGKGCFIATAALGSTGTVELDTLRAFRDKILLKFALGRLFVDIYYRVSPPMARAVETRPYLQISVRALLRIAASTLPVLFGLQHETLCREGRDPEADLPAPVSTRSSSS